MSNKHTWREAEADTVHALLVLACYQSPQRQQPENRAPGSASVSVQDEIDVLAKAQEDSPVSSMMAIDALESKPMPC